MPLLPLFALPFIRLHLPPENSFASQTVIVTGGNTGLGLETVRHIVSVGASKVILGVRTISEGEAAKVDIEETTKRHGVVEVWPLDLESFDIVKTFTSRAAGLERLDAAIVGAGLASAQWNITSDGWEKTLQVKVLSTLLCLLLMPILVQTRKSHPETRPHLVVLGSDIHLDAKFKERDARNILEVLNNKERWEESSKKEPVERYAVTKLFDLYIANELAHLTPSVLGEPAVVVDVVTPSFCKSELLSREAGAPFILVVLQALTARTVADGSKTIVHAAVCGPEAHRKYLEHQKVTMWVPCFESDRHTN